MRRSGLGEPKKRAIVTSFLDRCDSEARQTGGNIACREETASRKLVSKGKGQMKTRSLSLSPMAIEEVRKAGEGLWKEEREARAQ